MWSFFQSFSSVFQAGLTEQTNDTSDILSDRWLFCHGMSLDVFKKACGCMLKLKTYYAKKYGVDTKVCFGNQDENGNIIRGRKLYSGSMLDCWLISCAIDPAPGALIITKFIV